MPSADVLAQIAAIIAGLTGLFTAVASVLTHRNVNDAKTIAADTNHKVSTENGSTLGENSDAVREAIAPKPTDTPAPTGA